MSTASGETSSDQPQRTSHQPGPLAILAATAIGGVIATRMGKAPFLLAAGAAAVALLNQKKADSPPPRPQSLPPPAPPPDSPAQSQVEEWLSRQIIREKEAPVVELSTDEVTPFESEEAYHPGSFLLDEADEISSSPPTHESFAVLTEPVPPPIQAPAPGLAKEAEPEAPSPPMREMPPPVLQTPPPVQEMWSSVLESSPPVSQPPPSVWQTPLPVQPMSPPVEETSSPAQEAPPPVFQAPRSEWQTPAPAQPMPPPVQRIPAPPAFPAMADAAWTLGVDPLPSLNEAPPYVAPVGSMFFSTPAPQEAPIAAQKPLRSDMFSTAPVRQEEIGPPLFFSSAVFEGAAFPDEIQVAPALEPFPHLEPLPTFGQPPMSESGPPIEPPADAETIPEISVQIAAPGDASFDPPLAALEQNPWQPEPDVFTTQPAASSAQTHTASSVVEAEIILRPRAPTQNTVIAKSKTAPPAEADNDAALPSSPEAPQKPKTRSSWLSWWRGD